MKARTAGFTGSLALHAAAISAVVGGAMWLAGPDRPPEASVEATSASGTPEIEIHTPRPEPKVPDFNPPDLPQLEMEIEITLPVEDFILPDPQTPVPEAPELVPAPTRPPPADRPMKPTADRRAPTPAVESPPASVTNPPPDYPRAARRRGQQGSVLVEFDVRADGTIADPRIAESSGYPSLDDAALRAVRAWKFLPATRNGRAVEAVHRIRFTFNLKD